MLRLILVILLTGICAFTDYRTGKIKNSITTSFLIIGIVLGAINGSVFQSLVGVLIPLVLIPLWRLKLIRAGDIKELMAIGSILGSYLLINAIFPIFLGILISILVQNRFNVVKILTSIFRIVKLLKDLVKKSLMKMPTDVSSINKEEYIFAPGIFVGMILAYVMNHYQVFLFFFNIKF